jgi:hypothetical protein
MSGFSGHNPFAAVPLIQVQTPMALDEVMTQSTAFVVGRQLTPTQLSMINQIADGHFGFLPIDCHERQVVAQLFHSLDKTNDGKLQAEDFVHPIATINAHLQAMWVVLADNFDFNNDGIIEPREFLSYFILKALFLDHSPPIDNGNIAAQFIAVNQRFTFFFQQGVNEFITAMNK